MRSWLSCWVSNIESTSMLRSVRCPRQNRQVGMAPDGPETTWSADVRPALPAQHGVCDTEALVNAGADLVVRSLDEVSRPALAAGRLKGKTLEGKVEA
jgi:hypothetical protein